MLGAFWTGKRSKTKRIAELSARKMQQYLILTMSGAFFFYETHSEEELNRMDGFGPGEVPIVRDQYQPLVESGLEDPNFHALIASVAASQNCTWLAMIVIVTTMVLLNGSSMISPNLEKSVLNCIDDGTKLSKAKSANI